MVPCTSGGRGRDSGMRLRGSRTLRARDCRGEEHAPTRHSGKRSRAAWKNISRLRLGTIRILWSSTWSRDVFGRFMRRCRKAARIGGPTNHRAAEISGLDAEDRGCAGRFVDTLHGTEPASRGAALWALERICAIEHLRTLPASMGCLLYPRTTLLMNES